MPTAVDCYIFCQTTDGKGIGSRGTYLKARAPQNTTLVRGLTCPAHNGSEKICGWAPAREREPAHESWPSRWMVAPRVIHVRAKHVLVLYWLPPFPPISKIGGDTMTSVRWNLPRQACWCRLIGFLGWTEMRDLRWNREDVAENESLEMG